MDIISWNKNPNHLNNFHFHLFHSLTASCLKRWLSSQLLSQISTTFISTSIARCYTFVTNYVSHLWRVSSAFVMHRVCLSSFKDNIIVYRKFWSFIFRSLTESCLKRWLSSQHQGQIWTTFISTSFVPCFTCSMMYVSHLWRVSRKSCQLFKINLSLFNQFKMFLSMFCSLTASCSKRWS